MALTAAKLDSVSGAFRRPPPFLFCSCHLLAGTPSLSTQQHTGVSLRLPAAAHPLSRQHTAEAEHMRPFLPQALIRQSRGTTTTSAGPLARDAGALDDAIKASAPHFVGENDLLIIGPGVLGRIVAEKWKQDHPCCQIFGQTLTTDHHDELVKLGIKPSLIGSNIDRFPYVMFCAPPSQSVDYPADVRLAASNWNGEGSFVFTSSSAAYDCSDNGLCNEDSPVVPIGRNPRTDVILKAENVVLESGGSVLRLAGLYKFDRGAHVYWLKKGIVEADPDHVVNLIHYEDAASLSIAILKQQLRGQILLGCDNHPLSRQEIMDCTNRSGKFSKVFQKFTGTGGPMGKRLNNSKTRAKLGWEPEYKSFPFFLGLTE